MKDDIIANIEKILHDSMLCIEDMSIMVKLLKEAIHMSDFDKICETQEMINNQHNILSERIRNIETKVAAMQDAQKRINNTIDEISRSIESMRTRIDDTTSTDTKRYDTITAQIKNITDKLLSIDHHAKLASERSGKQ